MQRLVEDKRAGCLIGLSQDFWIAAERLPMLQCIYPEGRVEPLLSAPDSKATEVWERADAIRELVRGRIEFSGPVTAHDLAELLCLPDSEIEQALLALEREGFVLRGRFRPRQKEQLLTPGLSAAESATEKTELEWCERAHFKRFHLPFRARPRRDMSRTRHEEMHTTMGSSTGEQRGTAEGHGPMLVGEIADRFMGHKRAQ
jgi:ATP-dependent Lhr-like helicase